MPKREFLQLAHTWDASKTNIAGWYVSEKYDGMRAYWDGGITRGMRVDAVPFSNTARGPREHASRPATGLWSRYGKIIYAPDFFLDKLPDFPLDGELYLGPGKFQELMSIVKRHDPDFRWYNVKYVVFDIPSDAQMFRDGEINNPNFKARFQGIVLKRPTEFGCMRFMEAVAFLNKWANTDPVVVAPQHRLPMQTDRAIDTLMERMDNVISNKGEGLILRKPESIWTPIRSHDLLKVKRYYDDEAVVIDVNVGKGKYEGMMGSLVVSWRGKTFELSGFTDEERQIGVSAGQLYCPHFPYGSVVTFKYRELTDEGYPKEARYLRKY